MQHLDEGTIHAWLDGALAPDESRRVEAHAASCDACSALVAEARGLIAASSRILTALDDVPGRVIPVSEGESAAVADDLAAVRARKAVAELSRRRRWWRQSRFAAAAGIMFVAAGTLVVMRQGGDRASADAAFERATDSAAPMPAAPPAPVPSAASPAVDRVDQSRSAAPTAVGADAAARRDGRLAKEEAAQRSALRRSEPQPRAIDEPSRDLVGAAGSRVQTRPDSLVAMKSRAQLQVGAQGGAQLPSAPAQQQQNLGQVSSSANRLAPTPVPPPSSASLADSTSRQARERDVSTEALRARANSDKALSANLFAGCYEIRPLAGARPSSPIPQSVMLDTAVVTRGDTSWYRVQTLASPPTTDMELMWRPVSQPAESVSPWVQIAVRRGQSTEAFVVAIERYADVVTTGAAAAGAAAKTAEARAVSPRPAVAATARQTSCPRR